MFDYCCYVSDTHMFDYCCYVSDTHMFDDAPVLHIMFSKKIAPEIYAKYTLRIGLLPITKLLNEYIGLRPRFCTSARLSQEIILKMVR